MRTVASRNVLALLASILLLVAPQLALAQSCTMTFDKNPVAPGEGTYLRWSVGGPNGSIYADMGGAGGYMNATYSGFFINDLGMTLANSGNAINLGKIGGGPDYSGKVWVAPYQLTTYTGSAGFTIPDCWAYDPTQQSCPSWYPSCSAILYMEGGSQSSAPAVAPAAPPPLAPTCTISVSPTTITKGQSTAVSWSSAHATSFSISEVGAVGLSGSKSVGPQKTTTYTGTASGAGGTATCTSGAVTVLEPTCSITFDKNPIDQGQSTTIRWTSSNSTLFYINGIGYVGASGSASVTPKQSANYSGYVSDDFTNVASCPVSLQVGGSEQVCPPEKILQNGVSVARKQQCPVGYVMQGNACIFAGCPGGYKLVGTQCILSGKQCTDKPYCQGADLVDGCTGDVLQQCEWGCFYGRCNEVPKPTASLKAVPSLVHSGNSTKISWTSTDTASCTVKSTNGDSWTGKSSTGNTSKPISAQTTFTLVCKGYKNSDPATVQRSVIVNIAPTYQER